MPIPRLRRCTALLCCLYGQYRGQQQQHKMLSADQCYQSVWRKISIHFVRHSATRIAKLAAYGLLQIVLRNCPAYAIGFEVQTDCVSSAAAALLGIYSAAYGHSIPRSALAIGQRCCFNRGQYKALLTIYRGQQRCLSLVKSSKVFYISLCFCCYYMVTLCAV